MVFLNNMFCQCFLSMSITFFFSISFVILIIRKTFYVICTTHQVRYYHFLIVEIFFWKCEFDADIKIK